MSVASYTPRVMQDGRTVPPPAVHALIIDALGLRPGEKVLDVGTGSGTTARALASACQGLEVHSVELEPVYGEVTEPDAEDIYFHVADGRHGLEHEAPFDAIVATCGCEAVPAAWVQQLREGGRLVAPVGSPAAQRLVLMVKEGGVLRLKRVLAYVRFSMMRERLT